jgi:hypothetical protein
MSSFDYIPRKDAKFDVWQNSFVKGIEANATLWGIPTDSIDALKVLQSEWTRTYLIAWNRNGSNGGEKLEKNEARKKYEKALRQFATCWTAGNDKISNADREGLGLTVKSETRTPVAVPVSCPRGIIDFSIPQWHKIRFRDATSGHRAKPKGVYGCEIWTKVGGEEPKGSDYAFLEICTKNSTMITYTPEEVGIKMYYRFRWINRRGKPGPWSAVVSGVVAG